jgi:hypothetical protein
VYLGFQQWNAVETPGCVGEFLHELRFGCIGGLVLLKEAAVMLLVNGRVLRGKEGGSGGQSVAEGILGGTLFTVDGAGSGGVERVGAIGVLRGLGIGFVMEASDPFWHGRMGISWGGAWMLLVVQGGLILREV